MSYGLLFIACLCVRNTLSFLDPCTFYPRWYNPLNKTTTIVPAPSCQKGIIDWDYPQGSLLITFNQKDAFQLCLKDWAIGDALTIFDNSFGKKAPLKPLSSEDQCIRSNGRTAVLDVDAPEEQLYMAGFSFEIKA